MLHTKFQGNRSTGLEEDFWSVFSHVWEWWPSCSYDQANENKIFISSSHKDDRMVSQKNALWLWNLIDLGPRSKNNFYLLYSCGLIELFSWILPPTLASLTATISEDALFSLFSIEKTKCLTMKKVKVMPGSSFKLTIMSPSPQCYIPKFKGIDPLVLKKKYSRFLPYTGMAAILAMCPA